MSPSDADLDRLAALLAKSMDIEMLDRIPCEEGRCAEA